MAPYLFFYNVCCVFLMATTTTLPVLWGQQSSKQLLHPFVALWEHGDLGVRASLGDERAERAE